MKTTVAAQVVCAAMILTGCDWPGGEDPAVAEIRAAQEALGDVMVVLAAATDQAAETVDHVRHTVERGEPMREVLPALDGAADTLLVAADDAEAAARTLAPELDSPAAGAVEVVADAVARSRDAAEAVVAEADHLGRLVDADAALEASVAGWDDPATAAAQSEQTGALAADLAELQPEPGDCPRLRDNRVRWAELLAERSGRLAEVAATEGDAAYDELLDAYRRVPFGEDRRAADAADRPCWLRHSAVAHSAEAVNEWVTALERALSPSRLKH